MSGNRKSVDFDPSSGGGAHHVRVEPGAIPRIQSSFERALDQLRPQVQSAIDDLRVRPWAGDPVSDAAAQRFNQASLDDGAGAYHALRDYQRQLRSAADALHTAHQAYCESDAQGGAELRPLR